MVQGPLPPVPGSQEPLSNSNIPNHQNPGSVPQALPGESIVSKQPIPHKGEMPDNKPINQRKFETTEATEPLVGSSAVQKERKIKAELKALSEQKNLPVAKDLLTNALAGKEKNTSKLIVKIKTKDGELIQLIPKDDNIKGKDRENLMKQALQAITGKLDGKQLEQSIISKQLDNLTLQLFDLNKQKTPEKTDKQLKTEIKQEVDSIMEEPLIIHLPEVLHPEKVLKNKASKNRKFG